jgi:hypothetical protein
MTEHKPPYTVNPDVLKSIPAPAPDAKMQEAFDEIARIIREALRVAAPFTSPKDTIELDYAKYDTMCNVLLAIREKYKEWQDTDTFVDGEVVIGEIGNLLEKAGY